MDNVNNLNGVPNFGHGYETDERPEEGVESDEGVEVGESTLGEQDGTESEESEASDSNRPKRGRPRKES